MGQSIHDYDKMAACTFCQNALPMPSTTDCAKKHKKNLSSLHKRTSLEILGGGSRHEFARLAPSARQPLAGSGGMLPRKILKNRVSLMLFPTFWCGFLCMEQVTNEKKILRILVKQNMNRKFARPLSKNCPTN